MTHVVISGTGLFTPEQSISNAELVTAFNAYVDAQNFLLLTYEDSKRRPIECIKQMADFLNIDVSEKQLERISGQREFDKRPDWPRMASDEQREYIDKVTRERVQGTILEKHYPYSDGNI